MLKLISRALFSLIITLLVISQAYAATPKKILFVGNSFSFYNNGIHNHFSSLIRANGDWNSKVNRTKLMTLSGGHIHEHLKGLEAYLKADKRGWDAVVLQGHSNEAILDNKKKRFEKSLQKAINIIRKKKLQPVLFMTWGYKGDAKMARDIADAYIKQGQKHNATVVPVGLAFSAAEKLFPEINLFVPDVLGVESTKNGAEISYRRDLKHPSQAGTYLAACVFYASLNRASPEGNLFHAQLDPDIALKLQKLSWQVVSDFKKRENKAL